MSSTYGWLTESALAIERPVPLRGVSQQSQLRLSAIVRKQRESLQQRLDAQRYLFVEAAKEGRVFTHDAPCSRRWTRPSKKPLDWIGRQLAGKNEGVTLRNAADELDRINNTRDVNTVSIHLERKAKLYDRLVGGVAHNTSAAQLLQLNQKRRIAQRDNPAVEPTGPLLSTEALAELLNLPEGSNAGLDDEKYVLKQGGV
ncbi:uncharacterized protein EMH_0009360 [Eimeria mitis]|uniref:Uncharacterized protein n=1 Tax=Eimeria mitis TaxID=44415 RepID=U6K1H3_9EIME|nr:uncharacterized protein EMH_0009360 [Eimeria mitis]CDJ31529.1 hypothetical protein, conserved [Eimeria mitis]